MGYTGYSPPPPLERSDQPGSGGFGGGGGVSSPTPGVGGLAGVNPNSPYNVGNANLQGFFNAWQSGVWNPTQMLGQAQINSLGRQSDLVGLQGGLQSDIAKQGAGWQLQDIGLSREGLGVQQGALARQMSLLPQQYGLQQQGFDITQKQEQQNADISQRNANEQAAARGAYTSVGANWARGDISQNLQNQFGQLGVQRQQAALNFKEQQAQQKDANSMLGIQVKKLGLSEEDVRGRLPNALDQIGISSQISVDQLLSEQYKTQQGMLSPLQGLFGDLYSMGGITVPSGG
jgi:hypothetical protein